MEQLATLFDNFSNFSWSVTLLLTVLLLKFIFSSYQNRQEYYLFRLYCQRLADKVNKAENSQSQQKLAGAIAVLITLAPLATILWLFEAFIELPWLWHGLLLFFALGQPTRYQQGFDVAQAITNKQIYVAKSTLAPLCLRKTDNLSSLGLAKACIEALTLHYLQKILTIALVYLALGPLGALASRLLLEMHYSWNPKKQQFIHFGRSVNALIAVLQWLPARLLTLVLLAGNVGQNLLLQWRLLAPYFFRWDNSIAIYALGLSLEVQLGGVAIYDLHKLRRPVFNQQARQPEPKDIVHGYQRLLWAMLLMLLLIIAVAILTNVLTPPTR